MIKTFPIQSGLATYYPKDSIIFSAEFYDDEFLLNVIFEDCHENIPHVFYVTNSTDVPSYYRHVLSAVKDGVIIHLYNNPHLEDTFPDDINFTS